MKQDLIFYSRALQSLLCKDENDSFTTQHPVRNRRPHRVRACHCPRRAGVDSDLRGEGQENHPRKGAM